VTGIVVDWTQSIPYVGYTGVSGPFLNGIKDQGICGSCWAFSGVDAIEAAYKLKTGNLLSFSEQYVVSCDTTDGAGCDGGNEQGVGVWVGRQGGIYTDSAYPYTSGSGGTTGTCRSLVKTSTNFIPLKITSQPVGYSSLASLQSYVRIQPVTIALAASSTVFQNYVSGILSSTSCGTTIDHAVLAVGYGTLNGINYVKIRNQWGTSWGDQGYALIDVNSCGILSTNAGWSYPILS